MVPVKEVRRKICLIGDGAVGKTSLVRRFVLDTFDDSYLTTIGTKVLKKRIKFNAENELIDLNMMIWDIMGQKEYKRIQDIAFQGTHGALIVCDVTRRETLENLEHWHNKLFGVTNEIPIIILANKYDLMDEAKFTSDDLNEVSKQYNTTSLFTSAKTGANVEEAFREIGRRLV